MTRRQFCVDTETTSLTESYATGSGVIWELALIERLPGGGRTEWLWRMQPDLPLADPKALEVGRYYERTAGMKRRDKLAHNLAGSPSRKGAPWSDPAAVAAIVAPLLDKATLHIAAPTFDDPYLKAFLRHYGQAPTWHHRVRDFGSMAWGYLQGKPDGDVLDVDASTDDFAAALGLNLAHYDRHTALGDARIIADGLDLMEGGE